MRAQNLRSLIIPALLLTAVAMWPRAAEAQRGGAPARPAPASGPARGGGSVGVGVTHGPVYGPGRGPVYGPVHGPVYRPVYGYGYPWYSYGYGYYGFGLGFSFGWGAPYYAYAYPYPYAYPYGYPVAYPFGYCCGYDDTSAIRLEVTPTTTEVYVDGYSAGTVDSYDGFFQRLRLRPGEHDLTLYLDGYRAVHQRVHVTTGGDQKVHYTMLPLPAGEAPEPRPQPPAPSEDQDQPDNSVRPGPPPRSMPQGRSAPPMRPQPSEPGAAPSGNFGAVSIRVQPVDADVNIDGEHWTGPANNERLVVQLSGGHHRVDVEKAGFERYSRDVDIRPGETLTLNVSLLRRDQ